MIINYYPINEDLARKAQHMSSNDEYVEGSATAAYRQAVDEAVQLAEFQKKQTDPVYHEKIDRMLDDYALALAKNINRKNSIASRLPSILFGVKGLHFPADQVERQRLDAEANRKQLQRIQTILDNIRNPSGPDRYVKPGQRRISSDDPEAVQKLKAKLERLEDRQTLMRAVNAYYREHNSLDDCPGLSAKEIKHLEADMSQQAEEIPYGNSRLNSINSRIHGIKRRISELTDRKEIGYVGWSFAGGIVKADRETNQLQIIFDGGTPAGLKYTLKHSNFHWEADTSVWYRQLNNRAIKAADRLDCIRPLSGKLPSELQKKETVQANPILAASWGFYIKDGTEAHESAEHFTCYEAAAARFQELRSRNGESASLTLGLEIPNGLCAADILQVRQNRNFLTDDFTRIERMRTNPAVSDILCRISKEIGIDRVRVETSRQTMQDVPFAEWDNPYFPAATPGSIAAGIYELALRCGSVKLGNADERSGHIAKLVRLIQSGTQGVNYVRMMAIVLAADAGTPKAVHESVDKLMEQFDEYQKSFQEKSRRRKKSRER